MESSATPSQEIPVVKPKRKRKKRNPVLKACDFCPKVLRSRLSWRNHVKVVHFKEKNFPCPHPGCEHKSVNKHVLERHVKAKHEHYRSDKRYPCEFCETGKVFMSKAGLRLHIESFHLEMRNFGCEQCDYKTTTSAALQRHVKSMHLKIKDVKCPHCDHCCSAKDTLKKHIKNRHTPKTLEQRKAKFRAKEEKSKAPLLKCKFCFFVTIKQDQLSKHVEECDLRPGKISETLKPGIEDVDSVVRKVLDDQINTSNGEETDDADEDTDEFLLEENSQMVLEKFAAAEAEIDKKIMEISELPGVKNSTQWPCFICPRKISSKDLLKKHIKKVHYHIMEFICNQCNFRSTQKSTWSKHMAKMHTEQFKDEVHSFVEMESDLNECSDMIRNMTQDIMRNSGEDTTEAKISPSYQSVTMEIDTQIRGLCLKLNMTEDLLRNIQCFVCPKTLLNIGEFREHFNAEHKNVRKFNCPQCSFWGTRKVAILRHLESQHLKPIRDYVQALENDDLAFFEFVNTSTNNEILMDPTKVQVRAPIDTVTDHSYNNVEPSPDANRILDHDYNSAGPRFPKPFMCKQCQCEFTSDKYLKKHLDTAHNIKKKCPHCDMIFQDTDDMVRHMNNAHFGLSKMFKCPHCHMKLSTFDELKSHISFVHDDRCPHCSEFKTKLLWKMRSHVQTCPKNRAAKPTMVNTTIQINTPSGKVTTNTENLPVMAKTPLKIFKLVSVIPTQKPQSS